MSTVQSGTIPPVPPPSDEREAERRRTRLIARTKLFTAIWALMLPTVVGMLVFNYYPKFDAVKYSFYEWDGSFTEEIVGFANYVEVTHDEDFWRAFNLVMILFVANLFKMWPSIFTAIVLHRLKNDRWRYFYQVLFVVPMVIPWLVWLLIWKSFYDPHVGILNKFLNGTGLMAALQTLDHKTWGMPGLADTLQPVRGGLDLAFGNPFGIILVGSSMLIAFAGREPKVSRRWFGWVLSVIFGLWLVGSAAYTFSLIAAGLLLGFFLTWGTHQLEGYDRYYAQRFLRRAATTLIVIGLVLIVTTMMWTESIGAFNNGKPAWLANAKLVVPAVIFWGFPWVGVVGVLLYLAALQGISNDVYEAAELDGIGPVGKMVHIELPLMLTMVRINLIFMTIGTLNTYMLFYVLLGINGGPDGAGDVPGLVMFREAFQNVRFGYACAMGMYLFMMILVLTVIYQKYVRVEK